jgi:hypothetical protein
MPLPSGFETPGMYGSASRCWGSASGSPMRDGMLTNDGNALEIDVRDERRFAVVVTNPGRKRELNINIHG